MHNSLSMVVPGQTGYLVNHYNQKELTWTFPANWLMSKPDIVPCVVHDVVHYLTLHWDRVIYVIEVDGELHKYPNLVFPTKELAERYLQTMLGQEQDYLMMDDWFATYGHKHQFRHSYHDFRAKYNRVAEGFEDLKGELHPYYEFPILANDPVLRDSTPEMFKKQMALVSPGQTGYFINHYSKDCPVPKRTRVGQEFLRDLPVFVKCEVQQVYQEPKMAYVLCDVIVDGKSYTESSQIFPSKELLEDYLLHVGLLEYPLKDAIEREWLEDNEAYYPQRRVRLLNFSNTVLVQPGDIGIIPNKAKMSNWYVKEYAWMQGKPDLVQCKVLDIFRRMDQHRSKIVYVISVDGVEYEYYDRIYKTEEQKRSYLRVSCSAIDCPQAERAVATDLWLQSVEGKHTFSKRYEDACELLGTCELFKETFNGELVALSNPQPARVSSF